jgi:heavy metal translocating P-type ATPase
MANLFNRQPFLFARHYRLFSFALIASVIALILELLEFHTAAHWTLGITALMPAAPLLRNMWDDLSSGGYGIDILALTAIITAVIIHQYWTAMVVVLMITGGKAVQDYAERRSKTELDSLLKQAPQQAHVIRGKKVIDVPVANIRIGDRIIIKPGEIVPVDARIIAGSGIFDESSMTGEGAPEIRKIDDILLSGSKNIDSEVTAKAMQIASHSQYQQIIKLVKAAGGSQSPLIRLANRYIIPFTLFAIIFGGIIWFVSGEAIRFLEVIVVATPLPLIIGAPLAMMGGISRSTRQGIIVRTGTALERLAQVRTVAFDKTGTLTEGKPVIANITTFGKISKDEILAYAASFGDYSDHILVATLEAEAESKKIRIPKARHFRVSPGNGLSSTVGGKKVLVGRLSFLEKHGVSLPKNYPLVNLQQTTTYVAVDGGLAGVIAFKDEIRPETAGTLDRLRELGVQHFIMITGDSKAAATAVGKRLGISEVHYDALPAAKLQTIDSVAKKPVAFVGDGVTDASVLTAADVGIALGARGSTTASESADLMIMQHSISYVSSALSIAKRTLKIARQSILIGVSLSITLMLVLATGRFRPIYGVLAREVIDSIVIFNALRAHNDFNQRSKLSK